MIHGIVQLSEIMVPYKYCKVERELKKSRESMAMTVVDGFVITEKSLDIQFVYLFNSFLLQSKKLKL
jgi:hypothetical protein